MKKIFYLLILNMLPNLSAMDIKKVSPGKEEETDELSFTTMPAEIRAKIFEHSFKKFKDANAENLLASYQNYFQMRQTSKQFRDELFKPYKKFLLSSLTEEDLKKLHQYILMSLEMKCLPKNLDLLLKLLARLKKFDPTFKNENDGTALIKASNTGKLEIVRLLMDLKVEVDELNKHRALLAASATGYIDISKLLINSDADINYANKQGFTVLMLAVMFGHKDMVELLLNSANPNISWYINRFGAEGESALKWAIRQGHKDIVKLLIEHGANINAIDSSGRTAKAFSAGGNKDITELFEN